MRHATRITVVLNSSILVNFVTRSAMQKYELNYNSWSQFVSAIQTHPGKLNCIPWLSNSYMWANFDLRITLKVCFYWILSRAYEFDKVVQKYKCWPNRIFNKHFTCTVLIKKRTYIDDLCSVVKEFSNLAALKKKFKEGCFFTIYELSNTFCKVTDPLAYSSSCGRWKPGGTSATIIVKSVGKVAFLNSFFLPPPAPGPMLINTLMFVHVIVLLYPNIE